MQLSLGTSSDRELMKKVKNECPEADEPYTP